MTVLARINDPADLKDCSVAELIELAAEIRQYIIDTVSRTGGHLAPSLGVVELTLALHRIYESPKDKIIWDVGHQAYAHKIITGRQEGFKKLRQKGGVSGFPRIGESPHDIYGVGHSSTSISVALGLACARDIKQEDFKTIAVIGDGSMTAGMAFEALNHAGSLEKDMLVVLNDNKMSISKNVGALSAYLNRIITGQFYNKTKVEVESLIGHIPNIGPALKELVCKIEEHLKGVIVPGSLFEELGFRYFGPIDGHNLGLLLETFENVKSLKGPILVHVITKKGKGYPPAEKNPTTFHGTSSFDTSTGKGKKSQGPPSFTNVFTKSLLKLARTNDRVVAITAAMAPGTGLADFAQKYPERFFDVGIAEQHAVTLAGGLACGGMRPLVAVYSTFMQRAVDQFIHDVALQDQPVVLCLDRAGVVGGDGGTHQGLYDISLLRSIPNLTLMAPAFEEDLSAMLEQAFASDSPSVIRYPRCVANSAPAGYDPKIFLGKAAVMIAGQEVAVWALGPMLERALEARELLAEEEIRVEIVNPRFIKPLDRELLLEQATIRNMSIVTLEDHALSGGFGSAVSELFKDENLSVDIVSLGIPDLFVEHGDRDDILNEFLSVNHIVDAVRRALADKLVRI